MPPRPDSFGGRVLAAATAILAELSPPEGWPARGRGWPDGSTLDRLKAAGWPTVRVVLDLPQHEHGPRAGHPGQRTADAPQPATCVPMAWLTELARRLDVPLARVCRGRIEDD